MNRHGKMKNKTDLTTFLYDVMDNELTLAKDYALKSVVGPQKDQERYKNNAIIHHNKYNVVKYIVDMINSKWTGPK